jgi:hypothetical protein
MCLSFSFSRSVSNVLWSGLKKHLAVKKVCDLGTVIHGSRLSLYCTYYFYSRMNGCCQIHCFKSRYIVILVLTLVCWKVKWKRWERFVSLEPSSTFDWTCLWIGKRILYEIWWLHDRDQVVIIMYTGLVHMMIVLELEIHLANDYVPNHKILVEVETFFHSNQSPHIVSSSPTSLNFACSWNYGSKVKPFNYHYTTSYLLYKIAMGLETNVHSHWNQLILLIISSHSTNFLHSLCWKIQ